MASIDDVGTPAVQLDAVLQFVLTVPFQEVWANKVCAGINASSRRSRNDLIVGAVWMGGECVFMPLVKAKLHLSQPPF